MQQKHKPKHFVSRRIGKSKAIKMSAGVLLTAASLMAINPAHSSERAGTFLVERCDEEFEDVNFCDAAAIAEYHKAMKKEVNFALKYILHFFSPDQDGFQEVVAIDPRTKQVTPVHIQIKPTSPVIYDLAGSSNNVFCFDGEVYGYRQADAGDNICFRLQENEYSKFGKSFIRIY